VVVERTRLPIACLALAMPGGRAALPAPGCRPRSQPMLRAELVFGRNVGNRLGGGEAAFARFTAEEITPRFPDGLTVVDGVGQWRDPARGRLVRERAKLVTIVFADDPAKRAALDAAYKRRFA